MKTYFFIAMSAVAIISLSCGIRSAFYGQSEGDNSLSPSAGDYFAQEPLPNVKADEKQGKEPGSGKEPGEDQEPGSGKEQPPSPPVGSGDFSMVDANGVIITKKNGMQKTIMPSGEVYYLPDEF